MKKVIIVGAILLLATMANAMYFANTDEKKQNISVGNMTFTPLNEQIALNAAGNVKISTSTDDDLQPSITRGPSGNVIVTHITHHSIFDQEAILVYSEDGSTWTAAASFQDEAGIIQYPDVVGISEAGDIGFSYIGSLSDYPLGTWRIGDITNPDTYTGVSYSWGETEDYEEVAVTYIHNLFITLFNMHNLYNWDIPGCPYIAYWTEEIDTPPEIGGQYFDGQSVFPTAPCTNIDIATGKDYFFLLFQRYNDTTDTYDVVYKKSVTDLDLLYTAGGGPGGMDKYADIEAMPWYGHVATGDFDAIDPNVAASGNNVAVVYMTNDNIYGDWNVECAYSSDDGTTWDVSTPGGTPQIDESNPAVYMSGSMVYCVYEKEGNLYLIESEDGGATWDEPVQVNEVDGTVVAGPRNIDISDGGIVWTDNRNGDVDIYYSALPTPIINIAISGGFGVSAAISNDGTVAAENLPWSVDLSGLVFVGASSTGTIATLAPGASESVGPGLVLGIGPTTITASAGGATTNADGFVLGPLVVGL